LSLPESSSASIVEVTNDWVASAIELATSKFNTLFKDLSNEASLLAELNATEAIEPRTLAEAKTLPEWAEWEAGIYEELTTIKKAGTWVLVDLPPGANVVGTK
jgi:hypothetical protein